MPDLVISAVGAVTPVGLSAPATCAALRASVARMEEIEVFSDGEHRESFGPVALGRAPVEWFEGGPVREEWPGHARFGVRPPPPDHLIIASGPSRLQRLARPAALEAFAEARLGENPVRRLGLYLGLSREDDPAPVLESLRAACPVSFAREECLTEGRAAALGALDRAVGDLGEERVDCALVGGVDSLLRLEALRRIDADGRLKLAMNPAGFVPGESAAFFVVEGRAAALSREVRPYAAVLGAAATREETDGTDRPSQGTGLTSALRRAAQAIDGSSAKPLVVCDLNGERHRSMEWGIVATRLSHRFGGFEDLWHPADCIGDTGAASGGLGVVWACTALRKGYAGTRHAVVWGASDDGPRAAAALGAENS